MEFKLRGVGGRRQFSPLFRPRKKKNPTFFSLEVSLKEMVEPREEKRAFFFFGSFSLALSSKRTKINTSLHSKGKKAEGRGRAEFVMGLVRRERKEKRRGLAWSRYWTKSFFALQYARANYRASLLSKPATFQN